MSADAVGGVWTYAVELRYALATRGVEVVIATLGPQAPPQPEPGLTHSGRLEWQEEPWDDVAAAGRWLQAVAERVQADVVHLGGYAHAALPWSLPTVVVGHSCVLSWHEWVRGTPAPAKWDRYREEVRAGMEAAGALVAPTQAMLDDLRRLYGLDRPGVVIHNGISAGPRPTQEREPVVLGAGRLWDEAKGLDALDRAAAASPWPIELAGDPGDPGDTGDPADTGDGGDTGVRHARLLGPLPRADLRRRMARAAIFAHPARYEPFGLGVLEAGAGGCALVLGDIPSLRELWHEAAVFVAPGDAGALALALNRLTGDPGERARLARRARARAASLDVGTMARAYAALYERLVTRKAVAT